MYSHLTCDGADLIRLSSSERRQSRSWPFRSSLDLITLSSSDSGHPHRDFPTDVNAFCLPVKLSPCRSLFAASPNLATSRPRHRVFACLLIAPEVLGSESQWKMSAFGSRFFLEKFQPISYIYPLKKPNFCSVWRAPPLQVAFILTPKWAASTLNLFTQHCVPVSHLHVPHQNSTSTCFSTV